MGLTLSAMQARIGLADMSLTELLKYIDVFQGKNPGTVSSGVTAQEYGDSLNHISVLTLSGAAITVGDNVALGVGKLLYTFPAGDIIVEKAFRNAGMTLTTGTPTTDTPEVGLGTVIAAGAITALSATGTFEDIMTGANLADMAGTKGILTVSQEVIIPAANPHTVYWNACVNPNWADTDDQAATIDGTVVLCWKGPFT